VVARKRSASTFAALETISGRLYNATTIVTIARAVSWCAGENEAGHAHDRLVFKVWQTLRITSLAPPRAPRSS
jgi:hypothetical protein